MRTVKSWLVVKADGTIKVRARRPLNLGLDEVGVLVNINIPDGWATIAQTPIDIAMPEPPAIVSGGVIV